MRSERDKNDTYSGDRRDLGDRGMKDMYIKCCMYKEKRHSHSRSTDHSLSQKCPRLVSPHLNFSCSTSLEHCGTPPTFTDEALLVDVLVEIMDGVRLLKKQAD